MVNPDLSLDIDKVLSTGGPVAESFVGFEERPEQVEMACAVQRAFGAGRHLVVEAGTGVGKSFAYLVPAIEQVYRGAGKILVSTFTITLQEQLINKDIPFLADCMPRGFTAVLAKGRGNYVCRRRLEFALRKQGLVFSQFGNELSAISDWVRQTKEGSLSDMPFVPKGRVWAAVNSEQGNCRRRRCPYFGDCFYRRARRRLESADIIVANHALMFSDLVLKEQQVSLLPAYRFVVVDEAHNIEHVAEDHFGLDISNHRVRYLLDGLHNPRTLKGLLGYRGVEAGSAIAMVGRIDKEARSFFKAIRDWYEGAKDETGGRCYKNFIDDTLSGHLNNLRLELAKLAKQMDDVDEKLEIMRFGDRCGMLAQDLGEFLVQKRADHVYWVECPGKDRGTVRLKSAPLNVGPDVKRCLFDKYESVILTSATLSCSPGAERGGFDFFAGRIGLDDFDTARLGSPFDYQKQVVVYIEKGLPNPNDATFAGAAAEAVKKYLRQTAGGAFVLFTSYDMLENMAEELGGWLKVNNMQLLQQGAEFDRSALLKRFRGEESVSKRCVLFGTDSFWQGVDVPGRSLCNVIIVRLPFSVPDQPLLAGRLEQIRERGGNPFREYQLPSAVIKFRQGFGRLIRSKRDRGIVVVLDSRIVTKRYGASFLAALPKCETRIVGGNRCEA